MLHIEYAVLSPICLHHFYILQVLLFQDQNYGLHYEYTIPSEPLPENQSSKGPEPLFMWTHTGWEDCDATCGGGEGFFSTYLSKIAIF